MEHLRNSTTWTDRRTSSERDELPELISGLIADGDVEINLESRLDLSQAFPGCWAVKAARDAIVLRPDRMPSPLLSPAVPVTLLDARRIRRKILLLFRLLHLL